MQPARQSPWMTALELAIAIVLPIAGLVIALVLFGTNRRRDATVVLVGTVVGFVIALLLYL
jgi:NO-binding membrane sensor protein with MHYT domain